MLGGLCGRCLIAGFCHYNALSESVLLHQVKQLLQMHQMLIQPLVQQCYGDWDVVAARLSSACGVRRHNNHLHKARESPSFFLARKRVLLAATLG